jgi:hypothetical protein
LYGLNLNQGPERVLALSCGGQIKKGGVASALWFACSGRTPNSVPRN